MAFVLSTLLDSVLYLNQTFAEVSRRVLELRT